MTTTEAEARSQPVRELRKGGSETSTVGTRTGSEAESRGRTSASALGNPLRQATGRHLRAQPSQAGGDTQTGRRKTEAGHTDGAGPVDSTDAAASIAADLCS